MLIKSFIKLRKWAYTTKGLAVIAILAAMIPGIFSSSNGDTITGGDKVMGDKIVYATKDDVPVFELNYNQSDDSFIFKTTQVNITLDKVEWFLPNKEDRGYIHKVFKSDFQSLTYGEIVSGIAEVSASLWSDSLSRFDFIRTLSCHIDSPPMRDGIPFVVEISYTQGKDSTSTMYTGYLVGLGRSAQDSKYSHFEVSKRGVSVNEAEQFGQSSWEWISKVAQTVGRWNKSNQGWNPLDSTQRCNHS